MSNKTIMIVYFSKYLYPYIYITTQTADKVVFENKQTHYKYGLGGTLSILLNYP